MSIPYVIPNGGGPQHTNGGVDDKYEGEEEDWDVDGDGHCPVFLGQEVQTRQLKYTVFEKSNS